MSFIWTGCFTSLKTSDHDQEYVPTWDGIKAVGTDLSLGKNEPRHEKICLQGSRPV